MSRIGRQPINVPTAVKVTVEPGLVTINGPKGTLMQDVDHEMLINIEDNKIVVSRPSDEKKFKSLHGLTRTLIANMVTGVTEGFQRSLDIVGVGYRAQESGDNKITLAVGFSHTVEITPLDGVELNLEGNTRIHVSGIDTQRVGQVAAQIRRVRPPNVYTGKGIRFLGEQVRRKAGKSAGRGR